MIVGQLLRSSFHAQPARDSDTFRAPGGIRGIEIPVLGDSDKGVVVESFGRS